MREARYDTARPAKIVNLLKNSNRPLSMKEIASKFTEVRYGTVAHTVYGLVRRGLVERAEEGGYIYAEPKTISNYHKHNAICQCMADKRTALALSELYDAGVEAGRSK